MKVLLDTCVLSELQRAGGSDVVRNAVSEFSDEELFLSVVSIGEIAKGIALLDDSIRKRNLRSWLHGLERDYNSKILDIDSATTHIWGELTASAQKKGRQVAAGDDGDADRRVPLRRQRQRYRFRRQRHGADRGLRPAAVQPRG